VQVSAAADFRQEGFVTGYTLVLPPGWRQIPVRTGTGEAIREVVRATFRNLPRHVSRDKMTPYRIELERRLSAAAESARRQGGTELYLPVEQVGGMVISASFVVSEGSLQAEPALGPAGLAADTDNAEPINLDGTAGVRTELAAPSDPANGIEYESRRVDYLVAVPGSQDRWLIFAFSALDAGDGDGHFNALLVELFDAIMSTFRWIRSTPV
jgi:hypothetical protein